MGARSAAEFRTLAPGATAAIHEAERVFRTQADTTYSFDGPGLFTQPEPKRQHALMDLVHVRQRDRLLAALPDEDKVDIESATGVGAGAFLQPPQGPDHVTPRMSDLHLKVALRRRLRFLHPAHDPTPSRPGPATHCFHQYARTHERHAGHTCGQVHGPGGNLDPRGVHAGYCEVGGHALHGHNAIRDWLATLLAEWTGMPTHTEQRVPEWDRQRTDPRSGETVWERAVLDVRFFDSQGNLTYADVAVVSAGTLSPDTLRQRAERPGRAAADMVTEKRRRYPPAQHPSAGLVPFVVESLGRPAQETVLLLRAAAPQDKKVRAVVLHRAWRSLSYLVQLRLAELLLSAETSAAAP